MIHSINGNVTVTVSHKHTSSRRNGEILGVVCSRPSLKKNTPLGSIYEKEGNYVR